MRRHNLLSSVRVHAALLQIGLGLLATAPLSGVAYAQEEAATSSDEIIVTARKREERLLDVPVSVEALSAETLEESRIGDAVDLVGRIPNLSTSSNLLSPGKDFVNLVIRGIGAQSAGSPAVATFVDGVYVPSLSFDVDFLGAERVEVLRGPQGTLFGRNTQGGAVNIVLARPDEDLVRRVALSYDNFETARAQAALSGPLGGDFFGALALDWSQSEGYLENPVVNPGFSTPADEWRRQSMRAALRYQPNPALDINLSVDTAHRQGLDGLPGVPRGTEDYIVRSEFQIDAEYDNTGAAFSVDADLGWATLTAITGWRDVSSRLPFDFDGSPEYTGNIHDLRTEQRILSQEARLQGQLLDGDLDWLAGVYLFEEDHNQDRRYALPDVDVFPSGIFIDAQDQHQTRTGQALFVDLTYTPISALDINVGLRISREEASTFTDLNFTIPDLFGPGSDLTIVESGSPPDVESDELSPTAAIVWRLTPSTSLYARYARGYKAGGFPLAPAAVSGNIAFDPEYSDNYELGIRGSIADGRFSFDASVFNIEITDQQVSTIVFLNGDPSLPVAAVANVGESVSQGFELSLEARPTDAFSLTADVGYVDARYVDYIDTVGADRSGERFPFTPRWTGRLGAEYTFALTEEIEATLHGDYVYVGDILSGSGVDIDLQYRVPEHETINVGARLRGDDWRFDVFVDNLTDEFIETRVFNVFFFVPDRPYSVVAPPRRVGARLTLDF